LDGRGGMPTFRDDLHDDQLAAILTYVRSFVGQQGLAHQARRRRRPHAAKAAAKSRGLQAH
jgi:mono/diheme cytochrome c family protein